MYELENQSMHLASCWAEPTRHTVEVGEEWSGFYCPYIPDMIAHDATEITLGIINDVVEFEDLRFDGDDETIDCEQEPSGFSGTIRNVGVPGQTPVLTSTGITVTESSVLGNMTVNGNILQSMGQDTENEVSPTVPVEDKDTEIDFDALLKGFS